LIGNVLIRSTAECGGKSKLIFSLRIDRYLID
jgi:hypothetical protein